MKWKVDKIDKISFKNIQGFLESLKPNNPEILKPRNQESLKPDLVAQDARKSIFPS